MNTGKTLARVAFTFAGLLLIAPSAQAQNRIYGQMPLPINPNPMIAPGVSLQQYAFNVKVIGRAYRNIPPYLLGYNPYPQVANFGPVFGPQFVPFAPPPVASGGGYTPVYGGNAYTGGYTGGVNPLTGQSYSGGYSPYGGGGYGGGYSPYGGYGEGYDLYGASSTLNAIGQLGLNMEQARILREKAEQAHLDTRKKQLDTLAYIRENTYTFTQQQADIANTILKRLQNTPTDQEVTSGKSQNTIMEDLARLSDVNYRGGSVMLDEDLLKQLNVTGQTANGVNIGLLRDNGRFAWPSVFDEKNIISEKQKKDIELHAQELYQQAVNSKLDRNTLRDLQSELGQLRDNLSKNVKEIPGRSFLEGQRFLDDFNAALRALEKGDAVLNLDFQQKFAKGGKTVQELAAYLKSNGLRLAPANPGDERAYQALQTALAAYSRLLHSQIAAAPREK
jgi:hypothetical protein